jgi:hypothetical protein
LTPLKTEVHNENEATTTLIDAKQHAHELIDRIPPDEMIAAVRFLEFMLLDPVAQAIATAPHDDELVSEEDASRIQSGQAAFSEGRGIPMEEVLGEFGLTMEDFPPLHSTR